MATSRDDTPYFNTAADSAMLKPNGLEDVDADIGDTKQKNRNDYVNVYSAKLEFASAATVGSAMMTFKSADSYMIFGGDITC